MPLGLWTGSSEVIKQYKNLLSRLMHRRLAGSNWSWERAIERLRGIKTFIIKTGAIERRGITTADKEQMAICKQLGLPFPQYKHLASLH